MNKSVIKILTIHNDEVIRSGIRRFLEDLNYICLEAENGRQGLELFHRERPDLIFIDLRMTEMDGLEVLRQIQKESPETPVIVVSGTGRLGDVIESLRTGAWDYLHKPIDGLTERKHAEELLKLNGSRLEALLRLNHMTVSSKQDLAVHTMEEAVRLTQSSLGYIAFLNEDETVLHMHAWSRSAMKQCLIETKPLVYPVETTGLWGEAVRQRKPIVTNDYSAPNPWKKGYPEGHVQVTRHINVPIFDKDKIVVVAGVGNKPFDYDDSDIQQLTLLMEGMWRIYQRYLSDKALRESEERNRKFESIGVLAGGIAHDFNNQLTAMLGNLELAMSDLSDLSPVMPAMESLKEVRKSALRLTDLCKQMLAYSGKGRFVIQQVDLNDVIHEMMHLLETSISKKAHLQPSLTVPLLKIEGDVIQLRQIILNLIVNASEAIGDEIGEVALSTGVLAADRAYLDAAVPACLHGLEHPLPEGNYVYLEVSDSGCGMDSEMQKRIFEPFYTTKFTGRGLGLAAVIGIVRGHKGAIMLSSYPAKGSTFRVLFPACKVINASAKASKNLQNGSLAWKSTGSILLVDDENEVRLVTKRILERWGFHVIEANNGQQAIELYRQHALKIVCAMIDLTMPFLDGEQTIRELKKINPALKTILFSGYGEQEALDRFAGKSPDCFLQKPFEIKVLKDKIRSLIE